MPSNSSPDAIPAYSQGELVAQFDRLCVEQLDLCEKLEEIADGLGAQSVHQNCKQMVDNMVPIMSRAHAFEATVFFPVLVSIVRHQTGERARAADRSLSQLRAELDEDICLVGEVAEALLEFGKEKSSISPDALGYLLRGLFVGLRRHLAYESEVMRTITHAY